jgi:nucleoside-diphosphate kinase
VEKTLVVLKPDAIQRGIMGDVIKRFENVGLKIIGAKMFVPEMDLLNKHYPVERKEFITGLGAKTLENYKEQGIDPKSHFGHSDPHKIGLEVQKWLVDFMTSGPVFAMVLEGPHAIEVVRKIRGHTLPLKAAPGTITGDYSFDSSAIANSELRPIRNMVHASGNKEEAEFEIKLWFTDDELFDEYESIHQNNMMKKNK